MHTDDEFTVLGLVMQLAPGETISLEMLAQYAYLERDEVKKIYEKLIAGGYLPDDGTVEMSDDGHY